MRDIRNLQRRVEQLEAARGGNLHVIERWIDETQDEALRRYSNCHAIKPSDLTIYLIRFSKPDNGLN